MRPTQVYLSVVAAVTLWVAATQGTFALARHLEPSERPLRTWEATLLNAGSGSLRIMPFAVLAVIALAPIATLAIAWLLRKSSFRLRDCALWAGVFAISAALFVVALRIEVSSSLLLPLLASAVI